jgi:hypothetical protein
MIKDLLLVVLVAAGLSVTAAAKGEENNWQQTYLNKEFTYVVAYDKPFPLGSPFKCKDKKLWKWDRIVRDYKGEPVRCTLETMTRGEYEVRDNISRIF